MTLTNRQKRWLKQQAHHLRPVVSIGQHGVTPAVLAELDGALSHHELLKIKVAAGDRDERDAMIEQLAANSGAELIARIGHVAALYRPNPDKPEPLTLPRD